MTNKPLNTHHFSISSLAVEYCYFVKNKKKINKTKLPNYLRESHDCSVVPLHIGQIARNILINGNQILN